MTTNKTLRARFELFYKTITPAVPQAGYEDITMDAAYLSYKAATTEANKRLEALEKQIVEMTAYEKSMQNGVCEDAKQITELQASNNHLRESLQHILDDYIQTTLSATPAESLQAHDDELIKKCAKVCDKWIGLEAVADAILALKEVK